MNDEYDMYDDDDFELATSDITEHATALRDLELIITIEKWVTKLTSKERGYTELCYLRMLRRMVIHRQVCWPFVNLPPMGPLQPLSQFLNTPGAVCNEMTRSDRCLIKHLQKETCTRASQTIREYETNEGKDEDKSELINGLINPYKEKAEIAIKKTNMYSEVDAKLDSNDGGKKDNDDKNSNVAYKNDNDKIGNDGEYDMKDEEDNKGEKTKTKHIDNKKGSRNRR